MRAEVNDLRSAITACEQLGELVTVNREVEANIELPSIMNAVGRQPRPCALVFERIKNYPGATVAAKVLGSFQRFARMYDLPQDLRSLKLELVAALQNPIQPRLLSSGPCKQNVITTNIDIAKIVPPVQGALQVDSLYYQPVAITRHPHTGELNTAIYRAAIQAPDRLTVNARTDRHGGLQISAGKTGNKPIPVALVIGVEPALWMAANAKLPYSFNELTYAGGIKKKPIEVVKCETIDLEVPANAEVVIEGEFRPPFELGTEGPWPEYLRYLGMQIHPPIMDITAVTFRNDPITYVSIPASGRGDEAVTLGNQAQLLRLLREFAADFVVDSYLTPGAVLHHAIVKVKKTEAHHEGLQINVALAAFDFSPTLDLVILVDDDINIHDWSEIDWAICTRCNPAKQVHILPEARTQQIVPIVGVRELDDEPLVKAKMIIDTTIPWKYKTRELSAGLGFFTQSKWLDIKLADYMNGGDLAKLAQKPELTMAHPKLSSGGM